MAGAPASIREAAAHAGVSVRTVSNVLNRQAVFEPELVVRRSSQARPGPAG